MDDYPGLGRFIRNGEISPTRVFPFGGANDDTQAADLCLIFSRLENSLVGLVDQLEFLFTLHSLRTVIFGIFFFFFSIEAF